MRVEVQIEVSESGGELGLRWVRVEVRVEVSEG